jgi:hypothetical protein
MTTMMAVQSSNLAAVGYDEQTMTLSVQFKSSPRIYRYAKVPEDEYAALVNSDSIGRYFLQNIKDQYDEV